MKHLLLAAVLAAGLVAPVWAHTPLPEVAAKVQELLTRLGHDSGPIDGIVGPLTRAAIRAFQTAQELEVTGRFSKGLFDAVAEAADMDPPERAELCKILYENRWDVRAADWCRRAGEEGDAKAQFYLGTLYYDGRGVPQVWSEAAKWYLEAAEQGEAVAQFNLGNMYVAGKDVPKNFVQAHMWFNLAGAALTGVRRAKAVQNRDLTAKRMNAAEIDEAQKLAREWKRESE